MNRSNSSAPFENVPKNDEKGFFFFMGLSDLLYFVFYERGAWYKCQKSWLTWGVAWNFLQLHQRSKEVNADKWKSINKQIAYLYEFFENFID